MELQPLLPLTLQQSPLAFSWLSISPCHALAGTLDLLMTDVPDLVRVGVATPIGNSDHSSLSAVISMTQAVPNLCVSRKVS